MTISITLYTAYYFALLTFMSTLKHFNKYKICCFSQRKNLITVLWLSFNVTMANAFLEFGNVMEILTVMTIQMKWDTVVSKTWVIFTKLKLLIMLLN